MLSKLTVSLGEKNNQHFLSDTVQIFYAKNILFQNFHCTSLSWLTILTVYYVVVHIGNKKITA